MAAIPKLRLRCANAMMRNFIYFIAILLIKFL